MGKKVEFKVCGLTAKYFVPLFLVVIICTYGGFMPTVKIGETTGVGMVGTLAFLMSVGGLFFWLGNSIPIVNSYLGGSVLFCMFGPALLNYFGLLPETTVKGVSILMKYGFQDVYIAALLCGSVLYMDRKILLGAISRYLPAILGSQVFALGFCFLGGLITGYGPLNAIFDIGAPTMSGGSGGALVTIPILYTDLSGTDWMSMSGMFLCYVSLSNVVAVLMCALSKPILKKLGMVSPDENPAILRKAGTMQTESTEQLPALSEDPAKVCGGIFICLGIYLLGTILGKLPGTKVIAGLAWAIIIAVVVKCTGIMDEKITNYTVNGMNFMLKGLLPAIIAGIGINSISIETMISYFTPAALVIIVLAVLGAYIGAIIFGQLFGLWGYEAGITAGLCCCNIGGSGDLAVLTAGDRMSLLAFSSISTRIGGALMVVWIGFLYPLLMLK